MGEVREKVEEKVSVIVPIYNVEKYLDQCIESIVNQTYKNLEIILVNDGSPDNCGAMCDKYAEKDSRIIVVHQENQGVSVARNTGIDLATGTYITFADPDDYLHLEMIETLVRKKEPEADVVICNFARVTEDGRIINNTTAQNQFLNIEQFIESYKQIKEYNVLYTPWNKLYITEIIKNSKIIFESKFDGNEDAFFNLNYLKCCNYIQFISSSLYNYVANPNSVTHNFIANIFQLKLSFIELEQRFFNLDKTSQEYFSVVLVIYLGAIHHLAGLKNPLSHKECISQINASGNSVEVREALALCKKSDSYKMKIVRFLAKRRLYSCVYWGYYVGYRLKAFIR